MSFDPAKYTKSAWLKGEDLEEGERMVVTIKKAYEHEFPSGDTQPVLEFLEIDQKLSLNKTRIRKLVDLLGPDPEEWIDQKIALYAVDVNFNGKTMPSIAITSPPRKRTAPSDADDVMFERN